MSQEPEEPITLSDYDPGWALAFDQERQLLAEVLSEWLVGPIEHVGSTAVSGLRSKPILDIMAAVRTLEVSRPAIEAVAGLQYRYFPYRPDIMHWFCKPSPAKRTHHLHLVPLDSPLWSDRLLFRDVLRAQPAVAAEYAALKARLAERYRLDREAYTEAKGLFIENVLARARPARSARAVDRGPA